MAHDDAVRCAQTKVAFKFANFRVVKESYRSCVRGTALNGKCGCCGRGCRCWSVRPHVQEDMFVIGGALVSRRRPVLSIHKVFARVTEFLAQLVHHLFYIISSSLISHLLTMESSILIQIKESFAPLFLLRSFFHSCHFLTKI